jgi:hypothetical protein
MNCGVCSQCVDRRFAVLAGNCAQYEPAEIYEVELLRDSRERGRDIVMLGSYVRSAQRFATMSEAAFLWNYGEVFPRVLSALTPDGLRGFARRELCHAASKMPRTVTARQS